MYCLLDDLLTLNSLWMLRPIKKNASIQMIYYAFDRTCKVTVFFNCLNTFCEIWLIVSKLNTQANKTTTLGNKPFTSVKLKLGYRNLTILCKNGTLMSKWNTLASYEYTFRSAATHWSTLYKTLQSFMFTVFIQFHRGHVFTTTKINTKYCTLQDCTLQCSKYSLSKNK